jgi:hypothetical protein
MKFSFECFIKLCRRRASGKNFLLAVLLPLSKTPQGKPIDFRLVGYVCKKCCRKKSRLLEIMSKNPDLSFARLVPKRAKETVNAA